MHISKMLRGGIVIGALATGGAIAGIAGAAAAPTTSTKTPAPPTSSTPATPAPAPKSGTPNGHPCPNMGSHSSGGAYEGPGPGSSSSAGYSGAAPEVSYQ
jgi:hypothetical protein